MYIKQTTVQVWLDFHLICRPQTIGSILKPHTQTPTLLNFCECSSSRVEVCEWNVSLILNECTLILIAVRCVCYSQTTLKRDSQESNWCVIQCPAECKGVQPVKAVWFVWLVHKLISLGSFHFTNCPNHTRQDTSLRSSTI